MLASLHLTLEVDYVYASLGGRDRVQVKTERLT